MDETEEEEYYDTAPREYVTTTRSGRKVYTVARLIVPVPGNDDDVAELVQFDAENGPDCEDGLSERSSVDDDEDGDDSDFMEGEEEEEEEESSSSGEEEEEEEESSSSGEEEEEEGPTPFVRNLHTQ